MTNPFSLEGKNAWVTGACYGIGFAIAKAFAQAGANHILYVDGGILAYIGKQPQ